MWVFKDRAFSLYSLDQGRYVSIERSHLIPTLDFPMIARFALRPDTPRALREFEAALRG